MLWFSWFCIRLRKGSHIRRERKRHQTCGYLIPNRQKKVEFVIIAWSRGVQSFTFISEPPFVGPEIRKEREREEQRRNWRKTFWCRTDVLFLYQLNPTICCSSICVYRYIYIILLHLFTFS